MPNLGELHFGRKRIQPARGDLLEYFDAARDVLKHDLLAFTGAEIEVIGTSFARCIADHRYTCWACAIMPDHAHVIVRKHRDQAEEMIGNLQHASRDALKRNRMREVDHPVWGGPGWKVFLDHPREVRRTIRYVENNPVKIGRPRQEWSLVKPYDDWPLHEGHNPKSPYARALRAAGRYPEDR